MPNAPQIVACAILFAITAPNGRAQTAATGTTPKNRAHDLIADENKYDPSQRARFEEALAKTPDPAPQKTEPATTATDTTAQPDIPAPDVIMEPIIVTAKRDPFIQKELARMDDLMAVLEQKLKVSQLEEVINNPRIKLPLLGGITHDMRTAGVQMEISYLQQLKILLKFMHVARTPEEYQRAYENWYRLRYDKPPPASKTKKLMESKTVKERFSGTPPAAPAASGTSAVATGTTPK